MREGGLALTQLATHSAKLSIKAVVKVRGGGEEEERKKHAALLQTLYGLLIQEFHKSLRPVMRTPLLLRAWLSVTGRPRGPCTLRPN